MGESTLKSIVPLQSVENSDIEESWLRLEETTPLGRFHKKFWGKSMQEDEDEWRRTQSCSTYNDDEVAGDVLPGCYFLDLEGYCFPHDCSKVWVRADYIRIYDYLVERYNLLARKGRCAPAAVITGQPGVGKSLWIFYAIRRCLAERRPVIWIFNHCSFLFVAEGVFDLPPGFYQEDFRCVVWTFVDADDPENQTGPASRLLGHGTPLSIIYVSSPQRKRWSRLQKMVPTAVLIMNPWTKQELYRCIPNLPHARIDETFDLYGPTPSLCLAPEEYNDEVNDEISKLTPETLRKLVFRLLWFEMIPTLCKLLLLSRTDRHDVCSSIVSPISMVIHSKLAIHLRKMQIHNLGHLYDNFLRLEAGGMTQLLFEAIVQGRLLEGMELEVVEMIKPGTASSLRQKYGTQSGKAPHPLWYTAHTPLPDASPEELRAMAVQVRYKIVIPPSQMENEASEYIEPNTLYIHTAIQHLGFGSFILLDGLLYIFQPTTALKHDIPHALMDFFFQRHGAPSMRDWRFVFLILPGGTLTSSETANTQLREVRLCSAVVRIK